MVARRPGQVDIMSRTDIHRPIWVMETDPTVRHWFKDFHHHQDGICNFAEYLASHEWVTPIGCYRQIWSGCPNICGCGLCVGRNSRKYRWRQTRAWWRATRQNLVKANVWDQEDIDVHVPRRFTGGWW